MAVYTDITDPRHQDQLTEIEQAFGLTIIAIEGIPLGSSDSVFKVHVREFDAPLVLTIHEPPEVTPAGLSNEAAQTMLRYTEYMAKATGSTSDRFGEPVKIRVLQPLKAYPSTQKQAPFVELTLDGVAKPASLVPYIEGKSYVNSPEELAAPEEAYLAGRALGAYLTVSHTYPTPELFPDYDFEQITRQISRISNNNETFERLGYVLSDHNLKGIEAEDLGRDYLSEIQASGQQLLAHWRRISIKEPAFLRTLIHGDLFADNVIIDDDGQLILLDFSETSYSSIGIDIGVALNSWASQNGKPVPQNAFRFLEGFDSVIRLTGQQLAQIPIYTQIGAFRWEIFRVQRIELQDPYRRAMRSPAEFQSLRHAWRQLQGLFDGLRSVEELPLRLGLSRNNTV